jgi:hypothetical protein
MGRNVEGHLMLGWEVDRYDAKGLDDDDELTDDAARRVREIMGKYELPYEQWSLYVPCDYIWIGLKLVETSWMSTTDLRVGEWGEFLAANAELLEHKARELYEAIMGKPADTPPLVMCVGCEG